MKFSNDIFTNWGEQYFCAKLFVNPSTNKEVMERTNPDGNTSKCRCGDNVST